MKELIGLDFFAKLLYPSQLKAHNGTLYFIGKTTDIEQNTYDSDLYRLDGGAPIRLTSTRDIQAYAFTDKGIVFPSTRLEKDRKAIKNGEPLTVFQCLPYHGGEAQEHLRLPYSVTQAEWLPDGRLLFLATIDHTLQSFLAEYEGDMEKALKSKREQDEALSVIDEVPFWFNGRGFVGKKRTGLYLYDGTEARLLTDPWANVENLVLNEERTKALFTQRVYEDMEPDTNTLHLVDLNEGKARPVKGVPSGVTEDIAFGPNNTVLITFTEEDAPHGLAATNASLCRIGLSSGDMTILDDSGSYNYYNSVGSDTKLGNIGAGLIVSGESVSFLATLFGNCHIMRCNLADNSIAQVTHTDGMVAECIAYEDGYAALAMRGNSPCEIYTVDREGNETALSNLNGALMDAHETVTPIPLSFTNKEGNEIHGWIMPPVDYVPGKVYPTILNIHGGPKTAYGPVLFHEMQYWCAQGYAVLFCNPTGSDGRGSAFADIRGKYGTVEYNDIMQFVDEALTRYGFISSMQMGVTGGSYGGFMTNWIIGHTDRFRAAASQRSISNWVGFFGTSDIGHFFAKDQIQATPWTDERKLWHDSPLKYADKVKTPTLFIHSEEDYRCSMFEGVQMYYALRYFGVDTRLCLFKGENHELSRSGKPKNRIRRLQEITRWMDKYLKAPIDTP